MASPPHIVMLRSVAPHTRLVDERAAAEATAIARAHRDSATISEIADAAEMTAAEAIRTIAERT